MVTTNNAFIDVYCQLNKDNLSLLDDIYHSGIVFEDPAHKVVAINALTGLSVDGKALHVSPFNLMDQINEWGFSQYDGIFGVNFTDLSIQDSVTRSCKNNDNKNSNHNDPVATKVFAAILADWHTAFNRNSAVLDQYGYDERFVQMWRYL